MQYSMKLLYSVTCCLQNDNFAALSWRNYNVENVETSVDENHTIYLKLKTFKSICQ